MTGPTLAVRTVIRTLAACVAFLAIAGAVVMYVKLGLGHDSVYGLVRRFDLDAEMNIPTWFSSGLLLISAGLYGYIALRAWAEGDRFRRHWRGLALIFLVMSIDETAGLHGLMTKPLRTSLHLTGIFYYSWVLPVMVGLALFLISYARFIWHLPSHTRKWMVLSGIVYVSGALGGELAEGAYKSAVGIDVIFGTLTVIEETLEMAGATMLIYTLLTYIAARWGELRLAAPSSAYGYSSRSTAAGAAPIARAAGTAHAPAPSTSRASATPL